MGGVSLQYYTDRADASLAETVRGIRGQHNEFATDYLGDPSQDDDNRTCTRLVAWQKPGSDTWQIERYTVLGAAMGRAIKKENESKTDLCFFDALEYCASFQMMQMEIGKIAFPAEDGDDIASLRDVAKAAGQVIDTDGRLHPCAYGRILGDGFFSKDDIAIARQTRAQQIVPETKPQPSSALALLRDNGSVAVQVSDQDMLRTVGDKDSLIRAYQTAIHTGTNMMDAFARAARINFKYTYGAFDTVLLGVAGVFTAGYKPAKWIINGNADILPVKGFHMARNKFMAAIQALPEDHMRSKMTEFSKAVNIAFLIERAATHVKDPSKRSDKDIRKAMALAAEACVQAGYNDADTQRVKKSLMEGGVLLSQFYDDVAQQWSPFLTQSMSSFNDNVCFNWAKFYDGIKNTVDESAETDPDKLCEAVIASLNSIRGKIRKSTNHGEDYYELKFIGKFTKIAIKTRDEASLVDAINARIGDLSRGGLSPS